MKKIHIHTDCDFFAGCENMVGVLANLGLQQEEFQFSVSYRKSEVYEFGFQSRVSSEVTRYPLHLPTFNMAKRSSGRSQALPFRAFRFLFHLLEYMPLSFLVFWRMFYLFKKLKPDLLHINNGGFPGAYSCRVAVLAARLSGVRKIIFVVNNMALPYSSPYRWLDFLLDRLIVRGVDKFIVGSVVAKKKLSNVLKLEFDKVQNIPNGVAVRNLSTNPEEALSRYKLADFKGTIFGVVGLMVPRKGHMYLLETLKIIRQQNSVIENDIHVLIEGSGDLERDLRLFVSENDLSSIVTFIGAESNIFDFFYSIDCLIYPSIVDEDFPNVISEAMAMGKPVISTNVAGASEQIINGISGILVPRGSTLDLSRAILELANDRTIGLAMGKRALERYTALFTQEIAVAHYLNLYNALVVNK